MNTQEPLEPTCTPGDAVPDRELIAALVSLHDTVSDHFQTEVFAQVEAIACAEALVRVAEASERAQYLGLADIAVRLSEHVGAGGDAGVRRLLMRFKSAAADYVTQPGARDACNELLACVSAEPASLVTADELDILRLMLGMTPDEVGATAPVAEEEAPTPVESGVLAALHDEARTVLAEFEQLAGRLPHASEEERTELIAAMGGELESLIRGAEFSGLAALAAALGALRGALPDHATGELPALIGPAIIAYLEQPTSAAAAWEVAALIPDASVEPVARELLHVQVVETAAAAPTRATTAHAEDVSLELPGDINPELLDGLLTELPVQTAAFGHAVQRIVEGRASRDDLLVAKRAAHTLKGAANTVGVRGIAALTHTLEEILLALSDNGVLPNLGLAQTLSYASDCLEAMSEALCGAGAQPDDAVNVLQDVLNWANRIDAQGIEVARGAPAADAEPAASESAPRSVAEREPAAMLRVPATLIDELLRLVGETMTASVQVQNRIGQAMTQARAINRQNALLQQLVGELETMVDLRGVTAPGNTAAASVLAGDFDSLEFEQYNELHTLSRRLAEVATDAREMGLVAEEHLASLAELQEAQARLQVENQKAVMSTRMVPVSSVFSRLQRGVRQACRILDKEAELTLRGEGTVMDGNVLQELIDALMHLLRNAVDHGIESPAGRAAAGKPPVGRIELEFRREGDYIVVRCADDGQGLDLDAIRAHAELHGIVVPGAPLTPDEVARLILIPGFSTRAETTQVSGRGIGMDVVNSRVIELKGSLHLSSRRGAGLAVELKLPVTLLATNALIARIRNRVVALSTRGIEEIHYVAADGIAEIGTGLRAITTEPFEVAELEAILELPGDRRTRGRRGWPVLMVRLVSGALRAVVVQELLENRSVVVKPLGPYVPRAAGIIGATILGDGSVAPVIDLPESLYPPVYSLSLTQRQETKQETLEFSGRRRVLVVDDSISARRSLVQAVRDSGYDVRAAGDGLEAINILEQRVPDLIITDMEMPRMNGFELAQHVRAGEATRRVPIIMVTSRSTAKHRRQAELAGVNVYLTKPFDDRELLEQVEKLTRSAG